MADKKPKNSIDDRLFGIESRLEEIRQSNNNMAEFSETRILIRRLEKLLITIDDKISKLIKAS